MSLNSQLPYSAPESQGIASSSILAFVEAAEREIESLHSFMLLRHGQVLAEGWWAPYEAVLIEQKLHVIRDRSSGGRRAAVGRRPGVVILSRGCTGPAKRASRRHARA